MVFFDYINALLVAFFVSLIIVPLLTRWAVQAGQLDIPDDRKIHLQAVPRLGGVAIIVSFLFSVLMFLDLDRELRGLLVGLLVIFMVGLLDDLIGLSARQKLVGQISAALLTISISRLYIENLGDLFGFGAIILPFWLAVLFTVFAIVGVTNAINMIDGLDGLSGGVSAIVLAAFFFLFLGQNNTFGMTICVILIGALFGFLKHNTYPARIFMGDAGSLSLGFILSFLAIYLTQTANAAVSPAVPVLILGLPIADTLKVMTRRVLKGFSPFRPDMTHVHHSFLSLGLEHRFTVLLIYIWSFFWGLFAISFQQGPEYFLLGIYIFALVALYQVILYMRKHPDQFQLLTKDSPQSFRVSNFFVRAVRLSRFLTPLLSVSVVGYLLIALAVNSDINGGLDHFVLIVLISGMVLLLLPAEKRSRFEFVYYVAASLVVVWLTEASLHLPGDFNIDLHSASNLLFVFITIFVTLKIIFRPNDVVYLTSPLDYLFLAMIIALVAVPGELFIINKIPSAVIKTIFFILAFRILLVQGRNYRWLAFGGLQLTLLVIFIKMI